VLQNLFDTHCCPTFVRSTRLPSTSSTFVPTRWITLLVRTAVLHSYALVLCRQHRRPGFARVAEHRWYPLLSYIRTRCSYAINTADLRSYALQNLIGTHRCPTFAPAARLPPLPLATFVRTARLPSTLSTCLRTRCKTSSVRTAVLHSYALLVCRLHRRPVFVRVAEARWYARLSYIRTCCSSAVYIVDLRSYTLQKLVGTHCCPTFVRAARLPSTPSTCVRTRCKTSWVCTAVLHSYALLVCRLHRRPASVRVAEPRWYALLSYIPTCCESAVITAVYIRMHCSCAVAISDIRSYAYQNRAVTYRWFTFICVVSSALIRHCSRRRLRRWTLWYNIDFKYNNYFVIEEHSQLRVVAL